MGTVTFRYDAMRASKTANLLMMHYNYLEKKYVSYFIETKNRK